MEQASQNRSKKWRVKADKCVLLALLLSMTGCQHILPSQTPEPVTETSCDCSIKQAEISQPICTIEKAAEINSPKIKAAIKPQYVEEEKILIGRLEYFYIQPNNIKLKARIDTGAGLTSMNALDITNFERDGDDWVRFSLPVSKNKQEQIEKPVKRFVSIKQLSGKPQRRPVVSISVKLGDIIENVDVTLTDRSEYLYPLLIGRNYLRDRAIVDVSKKFTTK